MYKQILSILTFFLLFSISIDASNSAIEGESDWTMYQYNAQHTGYNDKDSITVPLQLLWKKNYHGVEQWVNSMSVIGERILVTTDYSYDFKSLAPPSIWCINVYNGEVLWERVHAHDSVLYTDQPSYHNGRIYVLEHGKNIYDVRMAEYDIVTGHLYTWFLFFAQAFDQIGSIVYDGKLIFPSGPYNGVHCVDLAVDSFIWWGDLPQVDDWSPAAYDTVVYSWNISLFSAHHLETGKYLWYIAPQYYDSAKSWDGVSLLNDKSVNIITSLKQQAPPFSYTGQNNAAVIDTTLQLAFLYNHLGVFAIDLVKLNKAWVKELEQTHFNILSTPSVCNGRVYNIFMDTLIAMDGLTGDELWRYELDTMSAYSTVIANGLIFVSTKYKTTAIDLETEQVMWEYPAGGHLAIANNRLFIGSITGDIYAFGRVATDIDENIANELPTGFELSQNYPNPFNPTTEISFTISKKSDLKLIIYNILGEEVRLLGNKQFSAGSHTIIWDGTDNNGGQVTSGMYFYTLESEQYTSSKKMILLK